MEREFDTIPIPKLVLRLGLPAMLAQFFNILYSVVDRIFVGHITPHGTLALAAVGICAPALTAVTAFATLLCIASQTIPDTFAALFTQDDSLVPLAASCIRKYAVGLLGVAVQYAFVDGLTAMGQMRAALPISFFRKGLYVLCVLVLPHLRPIQDVFWSAAISDLVGACVTLLVFGLVIAPRLKREMATEIP